MKVFRIAYTTLFAVAVICLSVSSVLAKDETRRIAAAIKSIRDISAAPKKGIPPALLKNAQAVAVFPGAAKTDFMVSGKQAEGVLLVKDGESAGKWSAPVFVALSGGTLGWQVVAGPMDIVLVFRSKKSIDSILKGPFLMDARQKVVIGPVGQSLKAATKEELAADITTYTRSGGAFAEVVVAGSLVKIDDPSNAAFYSTPKITGEAILSGSSLKTSDEVKTLQRLLSEYAARK